MFWATQIAWVIEEEEKTTQIQACKLNREFINVHIHE